MVIQTGRDFFFLDVLVSQFLKVPFKNGGECNRAVVIWTIHCVLCTGTIMILLKQVNSF